MLHEGETQRFFMTRRFSAPLLSLLIALVMLGVTSSPALTSFNGNPAIMSTEGRQDGLDVDCSGYTFEHLFEYDFALFELQILDDWATGDMAANAWVNGSNSPIVRDNLDGLFEGFPGGDNDWISTDERDAVRGIGPKCIADMETRLGMREGIPHSGGVDWNDLEFVEDGIALDEVNLVPESHPDTRSCINSGRSPDCKEVPTSTTEDMEISLFVADGQTNNVRWNQLPNGGVSNFTLAMNISNMSNAALVVTFPVLQGLRLYDFRVTDNQPESGETCDNIGEPSFAYLPDGALRVTQLVDFDRTQWDLVCNMFMDFTTMNLKPTMYPYGPKWLPPTAPSFQHQGQEHGDLLWPILETLGPAMKMDGLFSASLLTLDGVSQPMYWGISSSPNRKAQHKPLQPAHRLTHSEPWMKTIRERGPLGPSTQRLEPLMKTERTLASPSPPPDWSTSSFSRLALSKTDRWVVLENQSL